jgi:hypothetical protein
MEIDKVILLECINYLCDYSYDYITHYKVYDDIIISGVHKELDNYSGSKSVDITIDEYVSFLRSKKLNLINKKIHS